MSGEDVAFWGLMVAAAVLLWLNTRDARARRRDAAEARWDALIDAALAQGNSHNVTPLPVDRIEELADIEARRDMPHLDEYRELWSEGR